MTHAAYSTATKQFILIKVETLSPKTWCAAVPLIPEKVEAPTTIDNMHQTLADATKILFIEVRLDAYRFYWNSQMYKINTVLTTYHHITNII
jgi:hypothetical protein